MLLKVNKEFARAIEMANTLSYFNETNGVITKELLFLGSVLYESVIEPDYFIQKGLKKDQIVNIVAKYLKIKNENWTLECIEKYSISYIDGEEEKKNEYEMTKEVYDVFKNIEKIKNRNNILYNATPYIMLSYVFIRDRLILKMLTELKLLDPLDPEEAH